MTHKDYAGAVNNREPLLKPDEAAEYLGFTPGWLAKLRMKGSSLKHIKLGRRIRYARGDLDAWIAAGRSASTSQHKAE
jgi:excisionase family DNA binding protein